MLKMKTHLYIYNFQALHFFQFQLKKKKKKLALRYLSKYVLMLFCDKTRPKGEAARIHWKCWSYCSVACVFASCFTHVVAAKKKKKRNKWITSALNLMSNYSKHWWATSFKPHVQYRVGPSRANKTAVVGFWRRCGVEIVKWAGKTLLIFPDGCMLYVTLSTMNPLIYKVKANPGNVPRLSDSLQWHFSLAWTLCGTAGQERWKTLKKQ